MIDSLRRRDSVEAWQERLAPDRSPAPARIRHSRRITASHVNRRWTILRHETEATEKDQRQLFDAATEAEATCYERNIENYIGSVRLPVGVAGPLRIRGTYACGDYYVPLATTEAALVASYHRGSLLLTAAGGCSAALLSEGLERSPGLAFRRLSEAGQFVAWAAGQFDRFQQIAAATSNYLALNDMYFHLEGNHVYINFEYATGDAAGQNMVTIATEVICDYIRSSSPIIPERFLVEANFSGDKKASALSFLNVRGKKVTAETVISAELVKARLHTTPKDLTDAWRMCAVGGVMSGTMGVHGHYANALAAIYIATGQDAACVSESAVGVTRMELTDDGSLYAAVTLPNLIVGTVGGGTGLPTQRACLSVVNSRGTGRVRAFAEICAAVCLAGELSILGAIASGEFTRAHLRLARGRRAQVPTREAVR